MDYQVKTLNQADFRHLQPVISKCKLRTEEALGQQLVERPWEEHHLGCFQLGEPGQRLA